MKIYILLVFPMLLLIGQASGSDLDDLDRCSITGENAAWLIVRNNPLRVTEAKLVRGEVKLPADVLSNAVAFGYKDLVIKLLREKKLVELYGGDALSVAASMGRIDMSRLLLAHGISPNARNNVGNTALWAAVQYGCTDEMEFLIKHGAQVNFEIERDHNTPMINAVGGHHYQTAAMLLKNGYNVVPWELKIIKKILFRRSQSFVWDYLFSKLDVRPDTKSKSLARRPSQSTVPAPAPPTR